MKKILVLIYCLFVISCASVPDRAQDNKVIGTTPDGTPIITMPM